MCEMRGSGKEENADSRKRGVLKFKRCEMKLMRNLLLIVAVFIGSYAFVHVPRTSRAFEITKNLEIFTEVYKNLNQLYVEDIDPATMMNIGMKAIMKSLDPYTTYYSESEIEDFRFMSQGQYDGIGVRLDVVDDHITIMEPFEGGPAVAAGLRAGDRIISVDGIEVRGKSREEVNDIMVGTGGSELVLGIQRHGSEDVESITVSKGEVNVKNVPYSGVIRDGYGYIALSTFTQNAGDNVRGALLEMLNQEEDLKGLILDLRGNGGGLLGEAIKVANVFLPKDKVIVTTKGKSPEDDKSYRTRSDAVDEDLPLVVLIDGKSASASEIVSGAIQDFDRGVLLGERSYGKGLVQVTRRLPYNSQMKVTISKYYIPSGRCIQSVEYDDRGEPIMIADSLRTVFHTSGGREVLDGGGVKPDIELTGELNPDILQKLENNHLIFKYANDYYVKNESIPSLDEFDFTEYEDWENFLMANHFDFYSEKQEALNALVEKMGEDHAYTKEIQRIEKGLADEMKQSMEDHKDIILTKVGMEIASRYELQRGRVLYSLQHDPQITRAIEIMKDTSEYQSILRP